MASEELLTTLRVLTFITAITVGLSPFPEIYHLWGSTGVLLTLVTTYVAIAVAGVTHQSKHQVVNILGYLCVVMNLLLMFAPLETIKRIIRTKNASSMPVTMSVVAFVNGVLWVWTSAILDDMFVLTPNAAGAALGGIQVVVYIVFHPNNAVTTTQTDSANPELLLAVSLTRPSKRERKVMSMAS
ncbi:unnamed protein product [Phytophthora fragariaefolia]|uniref:Sugar transporter SWEET1 n=1 Tax=Phytophthora fragariaefolia TaxID=1490495 RepID=A0A9W6XDJ9_9STRA|nr:unnamed protein product [Phytophthora fragariaefolia]